jgi:plasmid stabilization system protein ParE
MRRRIEASRSALTDLDDSIQLLADQPRLGRQYLYRRLRLLPHGNYLVFYRERPGTIEVVRVIDGRRNVPDILDEL